MAFSAVLQPNLSSKFRFVSLDRIQKTCELVTEHRINLILHNRNSRFDVSKTAKRSSILLVGLNKQKPKLKKQTSGNFNLAQDLRLGVGNLESDVQSALAVLKKKEQDLQEVELKAMLDYSELNQAKEELDRRADGLAAASFRHKKLEEEMTQSNIELITQATEIEDLKLRLKERDLDVSMSESALSLKEEKINKMVNDLMRKIEDSANMESELKSRYTLLNAASIVVKKQELEIQELRKGILVKEEELRDFLKFRRVEKDKLEFAEVNLKKQTRAWLLAHEELKTLANEASMDRKKANENVKNFGRVEKLLATVRSELVSTQKTLSLSIEKEDEQQQLLEKQLIELEEQRCSIATYMTSLKDAQTELDSERIILKTAEAGNQALKLEVSLKKELIKELQKKLNKEKSLVEQARREVFSLQEHLNKRGADYEAQIKLIQVKEEELVEARLKIQHLSSEQASVYLMLKVNNLVLSDTRKMLEDVSQEMAWLRMLMAGREDQFNQAINMLKVTEEHAQAIQYDLSDGNLRFSEAETVVEQIAELPKKSVTSPKTKDHDTLNLHSEREHICHLLREKPNDVFRWNKEQLETELEITRESLRLREMEVLATQRGLSIKNAELDVVTQRLDEREKEFRLIREKLACHVDDYHEQYTLTHEKAVDKSVGDLAIEKLQLKAAQREVEAATSALGKLTEMSQELINLAHLNMEVDYKIQTVTHEHGINGNKESFGNVQAELAQFSALTDELVKQAGIVDYML